MTQPPQPHYGALARWLEDQLAARGWTVTDLANHSGLNRSGIQRWKSGALRPDMANARILADALGRPILELLVACEYLTAEEARQRNAAPVDPVKLTDDQLLRELRRRIKRSDVPLTREEMDDQPGRWATGGELPATAKRARAKRA